MAVEIDKALVSFAQAMPAGTEEFGQARELIKSGLAKAIAAAGGIPGGASAPTSPGTQFPGGGYTTGRP